MQIGFVLTARNSGFRKEERSPESTRETGRWGAVPKTSSKFDVYQVWEHRTPSNAAALWRSNRTLYQLYQKKTRYKKLVPYIEHRAQEDLNIKFELTQSRLYALTAKKQRNAGKMIFVAGIGIKLPNPWKEEEGKRCRTKQL